MSTKELEAAVAALPADELTQFSQWFEEFMADQWDRQIEQDMQAGRLDAALQKTDGHRKAGRITPV